MNGTIQIAREIMQRKELLAIAEQFATYNVQLSDEKESFEILNPYGKDAILVESEGVLASEPYIVCYTFYHIHLETVEQVIAYVRDILEGRRLVIGFFKDGRWSMSADLDKQELRDLSYTSLSKRMNMGKYGSDMLYGDHRELIEAADSFCVRGWAQDADFDAVFVTDAQGVVTVQKSN